MENGSTIGESMLGSCVDYDKGDEDITENLEGLSDDEVKHLADVVAKSRELEKMEKERKRRLEDDTNAKITEIEMKNVDDGDKMCIICGEKFMFLLNSKKVCDKCQKGVCGHCIDHFNGEISLCRICVMKIKNFGKTGKWFNIVAKENHRLRRSASFVFLNSMRRLKAKFSTQSINNSRQNSNVEPSRIRDIPNGDVRLESNYTPMYLPTKTPLRSSLKKDTYKTASAIPVSTTTSKKNVEYNVDQPDASTRQPSTSNSQSQHQPEPASNLQSMSGMSTSMLSVYSEAEESYKHKIPISGDICLAVYYDTQESRLNIFIDQCRNIAVADRKKGRTNPYIKTYLLPDKTKVSKKKSTSKTATVNPTFKETLSYRIDKTMLESRILSVAVWHKNTIFSYNFFLGEVQFVLANHDLTIQESFWFQLKPKMVYPIGASGLIFKGELIFDIQYKPSSLKNGKGAIHVTILEAKGLQGEHKHIKAYVKGYLLPDRSAKARRKTPVAKSGTDPTWSCLLQFDNVTFDELKDRSLELWVMHKNRLKASDFLGGIRLNLGLGLYCSQHVNWMDAQGAEKDLWQQLLSNSSESQRATINLRANLDYY